MLTSMTIEKARLYEQYRLPYPPAMMDDLFVHVGSVAVAADIGAGTGQLARLIAPRCQEVFLVEPDPSMRAVAAKACTDHANIRIVAGSAEHTTLARESLDLIVIGNAFHRFRSEALQELLRILKPMGWIAVISYGYTNQAFADRLFGQLSTLTGLASRSAKNWHSLPVEQVFGAGPIHNLAYVQSYPENWSQFWGGARSGIEAPEPQDAEFERFEAINRDVFDHFAVKGNITVEYTTHVQLGQPKRAI